MAEANTQSFANIVGGKGPAAAGVSSSLSRVPVTMEIILGAARLPLSELLALQNGSEITLDAAPGDPVTLLVNGCRIAKGELYVLESEGDKFGVKITEVLDAALPL